MKKNKVMATKNVHCKQTFHNDITSPGTTSQNPLRWRQAFAWLIINRIFVLYLERFGLKTIENSRSSAKSQGHKTDMIIDSTKSHNRTIMAPDSTRVSATESQWQKASRLLYEA